jgi:hypothetical protein
MRRLVNRFPTETTTPKRASERAAILISSAPRTPLAEAASAEAVSSERAQPVGALSRAEGKRVREVPIKIGQ